MFPVLYSCCNATLSNDDVRPKNPRRSLCDTVYYYRTCWSRDAMFNASHACIGHRTTSILIHVWGPDLETSPPSGRSRVDEDKRTYTSFTACLRFLLHWAMQTV